MLQQTGSSRPEHACKSALNSLDNQGCLCNAHTDLQNPGAAALSQPCLPHLPAQHHRCPSIGQLTGLTLQHAQVWSIRDPSWRYKLQAGADGAAHCLFSPSGTDLLVMSKDGMRVSAWSLQSITKIELSSCASLEPGLQISPDGRCLAIIEVSPPKGQQLCVLALTAASQMLCSDTKVRPDRARVLGLHVCV